MKCIAVISFLLAPAFFTLGWMLPALISAGVFAVSAIVSACHVFDDVDADSVPHSWWGGL